MTTTCARIAIFVTCITLLAAAPADAQLQFPSSWAGVWEFTTTERDCGSTTITDMYTDIDTICTGDDFSAGDEAEFNCDGFINDSAIDIDCSSTFDVFPGCELTIAYVVMGTRTGNNISGNETFSMTYVGDCPFADECTDGDIVGVRTAAEPPGCTSTAVTRLDWGRAKTLYR